MRRWHVLVVLAVSAGFLLLPYAAFQPANCQNGTEDETTQVEEPRTDEQITTVAEIQQEAKAVVESARSTALSQNGITEAWSGQTLAIDPNCASDGHEDDVCQKAAETILAAGATLWNGQGRPDLILSRRNAGLVVKNRIGNVLLWGTSYDEAVRVLVQQAVAEQNHWDEDGPRTLRKVQISNWDFFCTAQGNPPAVNREVLTSLLGLHRAEDRIPSICRRLIRQSDEPYHTRAELRQVGEAFLEDSRGDAWEYNWNRAKPWERQEYLRLVGELPPGVYALGVGVSGAAKQKEPTSYHEQYPEERDSYSAYTLPDTQMHKELCDGIRRDIGFIPDGLS